MSTPGFQAPKFSVGQRVYWPGYVQESRVGLCPDCLGKGTWHVETPAGETFDMSCSTCSAYIGRSEITVRFYVPRVTALTIGSIRWDQSLDRAGYVYMALETGVGTGSVYDENGLFADAEAAHVAATLRAMDAEKEYQARVKKNADEDKRKARRKPDPQAREIARLKARVRELEGGGA